MRTLLAIVTGLFVAAAFADTPASSVTGLWGIHETFGPQVKGLLVIDARLPHWQARIAGFAVPVQHTGHTLQFTLPEGLASFRGALTDKSGEITGQWIQAPDVILSGEYATPVILHETEKDVWQGKVQPLPDSITLYLQVNRAEDGSLTGYFRNPDFNFGHDNPYAISVQDDELTLTGAHNKHDVFHATHQSGSNVLQLQIPMIGRTLNLTQRDRDSAAGFYPATPASTTYTYRVPVRTSDGWATGSLVGAGLDPKPLNALVEHILNTQYHGFSTPYIHSLLIARHGKLVLEQYFYGHDREQTHDMRSAGKTFAGMLVGLALQHGALFKLDTPVYSLFPQYKSIANLDASKKAMTVKDLLTMTSGLACNDDDENSPGNEDTMQGQHAQQDWYKYTLDLPMQRAPGGSQAVYCSAGINLLGGVVRDTIDMPLPEFFYQYFAGPLDISTYHINLMPTGEAYMGGGMRMRPRDQLKLGQLYLDHGKWHGKQVIAASWVRQSLQAYSAFAPDHHYGFAWHLIDLKSGDKTYRVEEAGGNGGQFVLIIPELDVVVGFTAGNYGDFKTWYPFMTELVPQYIIPAARQQERKP
ncbi:MAG: serine hydrolase domain-containing protein [Gammaproteobacteria bacterium]